MIRIFNLKRQFLQTGVPSLPPRRARQKAAVHTVSSEKDGGVRACEVHVHVPRRPARHQNLTMRAYTNCAPPPCATCRSGVEWLRKMEGEGGRGGGTTATWQGRRKIAEQVVCACACARVCVRSDLSLSLSLSHAPIDRRPYHQNAPPLGEETVRDGVDMGCADDSDPDNRVERDLHRSARG